MEGFLKSDMAIKLRVEHPEWDFKKINEEAQAMLDRYPVDSVLASKKEINPFVSVDTELANRDEVQ